MDESDLKIPNQITDEYLRFATLRSQQEIDRYNSLTTKASIYLTAIALLLGALSMFYKDLPWGVTLMHIIFYVFNLAIMVVLVVITYNLFKFFWGREYSYPPDVFAIKKHAKELMDHFSGENEKRYKTNGDKEGVTNKAFKLYLADMFAECVDADYNANNKRSDELLVIGRCVIVLFILFIVSFVLFFIIKQRGVIDV